MRDIRTYIVLLLSAIASNAPVFADTNIAPQSAVTSIPYTGKAIDYLTDGKIAKEAYEYMKSAPLPIRIGKVMPVEYRFDFHKAVPISSVRLYQHNTDGRRPAASYTLDIDSNGNGIFDRTLHTETNGKGNEWYKYTFPTLPSAHSLRFQTKSYPREPGPNYGGAVLGEIEIYSPVELDIPEPTNLPKIPKLTEVLAQSRPINELIKPMDKPWNAQFQRGVFGSVWRFWNPGKSFDNHNAKKQIQSLENLHINRYWLYIHGYAPLPDALELIELPTDDTITYFIQRQIDYARKNKKNFVIYPFPSKVVPGYNDDILSKLSTQMHQQGMGLIANEQPLPYGLSGWDFPRVFKPNQYPCLLSSSFIRNSSTEFYKEIASTGIDGIVIGGDEFFFNGHTGLHEQDSPVCRSNGKGENQNCTPTCIQLFKDRTGEDYDHTKRSVIFGPVDAKWQVFEYGQLADLFREHVKAVKAINPDLVITSLFSAGQENRAAYGVAYDLIGARGMVLEMSSNPYWTHQSYLGHYLFANETKKLAGASLDRHAALTFQTTPTFTSEPFENPLMVYGPAFSSLMHGVRGISFYKHQNVISKGTREWVKRFFDLTVLLEQRGLLDFQAPRTIALLYSRASEDWWQASHAKPTEAAEAILYQNAVMEVLFRNGMPFDLYYLDQPLSYKEIEQYPLIVMPYPYSVSLEAVSTINKAINTGAKLIAIERLGEVDPFGLPHEKPLLSNLPSLIKINVELNGSNYEHFSQTVMEKIQNALGEDIPLSVNAFGHDIECALLEGPVSIKHLFCLNWEAKSVDIRLGVELDKGMYSVDVITLKHESPGALDGEAIFASEELQSFMLTLEPGQAKILSIKKSGHE